MIRTIIIQILRKLKKQLRCDLTLDWMNLCLCVCMFVRNKFTVEVYIVVHVPHCHVYSLRPNEERLG